MYMTSKQRSDESGQSLVEAMVSIAVLSIAALAIGAILVGSFQQTSTAERALNAQLNGMATAVTVSGNYSTSYTASVAIYPSVISPTTSNSTYVTITAPGASVAGVGIALTAVTSSTISTKWWLP
jgi:Tfp pilus assembly protein PilV